MFCGLSVSVRCGSVVDSLAVVDKRCAAVDVVGPVDVDVDGSVVVDVVGPVDVDVVGPVVVVGASVVDVVHPHHHEHVVVGIAVVVVDGCRVVCCSVVDELIRVSFIAEGNTCRNVQINQYQHLPTNQMRDLKHFGFGIGLE